MIMARKKLTTEGTEVEEVLDPEPTADDVEAVAGYERYFEVALGGVVSKLGVGAQDRATMVWIAHEFALEAYASKGIRGEKFLERLRPEG